MTHSPSSNATRTSSRSPQSGSWNLAFLDAPDVYESSSRQKISRPPFLYFVIGLIPGLLLGFYFGAYMT